MRKLLYAFVFASILVLAGSAGFASFDTPSGGGTVPDGEHQIWLPLMNGEHRVWLPVVKNVVPCVFDMKISSPVEGAIFRWGDSIPVSFSWRRVDAGTERNVVVFCAEKPGEGCRYVLEYWGGNTPGASEGESSFDLHKLPYFKTGVDGKYSIQGGASCERTPDGHTEIVRNFYIIGQSK